VVDGPVSGVISQVVDGVDDDQPSGGGFAGGDGLAEDGTARCKLGIAGALATIVNLGCTTTFAGNPNLLRRTGNAPLIS
jgi:hypothetical protein